MFILSLSTAHSFSVYTSTTRGESEYAIAFSIYQDRSVDFSSLGHYTWPAILLWGLDRVIRICRLFISYFATSKVESFSGPKISSSPKIELLPGRVIRLTIPTPKLFNWRPGQSAYLTIPKISSTPLEGHPFTISAIDAKSLQHSELKFLIQDRKGKGFTSRLYDSEETSTIGNVLIDGPYSTPPRVNGYDTVLLIASGSGVTFTLPLLLDLIE
jgi:ferric-chelate reductase